MKLTKQVETSLRLTLKIQKPHLLHKILSFPLRISSVNASNYSSKGNPEEKSAFFSLVINAIWMLLCLSMIILLFAILFEILSIAKDIFPYITLIVISSR